MRDLYQISGKHFVAGLETNRNGVVVNCAPILRRWCMNKHIDYIKDICKRRKLDCSLIAERPAELISEFFVAE